VNTASVTCSPAGFPNVYEDTAFWSTNLFQPAINLLKTGDELSKIGDAVDYAITLENDSSADTPDLTCTVTDALVGIDETFTVAAGADHVINVDDFIIPGGALDPFVNTASVTCSPAGFPNVYEDTASWDTNLFQPDIDLTKTADVDYSKAGDPIVYTIEIVNLSSEDSPNLVLDSFVDTLVSPVTVPADCQVLTFGETCTFDYIYTVQPDDPDPLENIATAVYNPEGFPNEVSDSGSATVDLLHPNYTLSKTCAEEPIFVGSTAVFNVVLENTGDVDLIVTLDEDVLDGDGNVIPAGTPIDLPVGQTLTYYVEIPNAPYPSVTNSIGSSATLPAWTGLSNVLTRTSSDTCEVRYWAFTPGFWKNHGPNEPSGHNAWQYTAYDTTDLLGDVFDATYLYETPRGFDDPFADLSLMNALSFKGGSGLRGAKEVLLRAGVAALLNASFHETFDYPPIHPAGVAVFDPVLGRDVLMSCAPDPITCPSPIVYYPYTSQGVIDAVNAALATGNRTAILALAYELDGYNNGIHYIDWSWPPPNGMLELNDLRDVPSGRRD
jgi:hypothetical protein